MCPPFSRTGLFLGRHYEGSLGHILTGTTWLLCYFYFYDHNMIIMLFLFLWCLPLICTNRPQISQHSYPNSKQRQNNLWQGGSLPGLWSCLLWPHQRHIVLWVLHLNYYPRHFIKSLSYWLIMNRWAKNSKGPTRIIKLLYGSMVI